MNMATPLALYLGIGAAFVSALAFAILLLPNRGAENARFLEGVLRPYAKRVSGVRLGVRPLTTLVQLLGTLRRRERMQGAGSSDDMGTRLELAGWPVRASEFAVLRGFAAAVATFGVWGLTQTWVLALLFGAVAWIAPRLLLSQKIDKRSEDFLAQLPDTLHLLASSLEAGHSLLQGLDAVVAESPAPTSTEFARAITEIRLGMPVGDALESMASRVGGEEFRWAVLAMNVQREVGGNLGVLLKTVADTLREREQLRRQVKVLSAEGRMSAVVLTGLPPLLGLYLAVVNPTYVGALFSTGAGRLMILFSLVLLGAGGLWMRKLIRIEV